MRSRPRDESGQTRFQRGASTFLKSVNTLWLNLSQCHKDLWNAHAAAYMYVNPWGESKKLSGFNWFMSINTSLAYCFQPTRTHPAAYSVPPLFPSYTLSFTGGQLIANFAGVEDMRLYAVIWYATPPIQATSIKDRSKFIRLIAFLNFNANHQDLNNYYQNVFGINLANLVGVANCNIIVYARRILLSTGYSSPFRIVPRKIT